MENNEKKTVKTTDEYKIGSIYYEPKKDFYILIISKTKNYVRGLITNMGNPNLKDRLYGINDVRIGIFEYRNWKFGFGNVYDINITDDTELNLVYSLSDNEFKAFEKINQAIIDGDMYYVLKDGSIRKIR